MILLTGGTGLLGMHLLLDLTRRGHQVRATFRNEARILRVEELFEYYEPTRYRELLKQVEWRKADIESLIELEPTFHDVKAVFHCAALVSFRNTDFQKLVRANRYGTANMVNLALKYKVEWFGYASSTAAIGKGASRDNLLLNEDSKWHPDVPVSGYAMSKHLAEKEVWRGMEEGLNAAMLNPSVIFGPGDWSESSLTIFRAVDRGLRFYAPGSNAIVDVRDVSKRMLFLFDQKITNQRYLVVGENLSFQRMTVAIAKRLNKKEPSIPVSSWMMGIAWRLATLVSFVTRKPTALTKDATESAFSNTSYDTSKMDHLIPEPYITLEDSIENTVQFREWQESRAKA